jgi:hypothetical protein
MSWSTVGRSAPFFVSVVVVQFQSHILRAHHSGEDSPSFLPSFLPSFIYLFIHSFIDHASSSRRRSGKQGCLLDR